MKLINQALIKKPQFDQILNELNSNYEDRLTGAYQLFDGALEGLINCIRIIHQIPDYDIKSQVGKSNTWIFGTVLKEIPGDQKEKLFLSNLFSDFVNLNPLIEDMTVYRKELTFPEDANETIKRQAQQSHKELKELYEHFKNRGSGVNKVIKKTARLLYCFRANLSHGPKSPMGPDLKFAKRNKAIINVAVPLMRKIFEVLFDYPSKRLCLYATFKSDGINHNFLKDALQNNIELRHGTVRGRIQNKDNNRYFEASNDGGKIEVEVATLNNPEMDLKRLKEFEGSNYALMMVRCEIEKEEKISVIFGQNLKNTQKWNLY